MEYVKRLNKIHKKLIKLSNKGKNNRDEFYKYINELIDNDNYTYFEEVMYIYYDFDIYNKTISDYKEDAWASICLNTESSISVKLYKLYNQKSVYRQGLDFYDNDNNIIGTIEEKDRLSDDYRYLVKNKMYSKLRGEIITYLLVSKYVNGVFISQETFNEYDYEIDSDDNLVNFYRQGIEYLKS